MFFYIVVLYILSKVYLHHHHHLIKHMTNMIVSYLFLIFHVLSDLHKNWPEISLINECECFIYMVPFEMVYFNKSFGRIRVGLKKEKHWLNARSRSCQINFWSFEVTFDEKSSYQKVRRILLDCIFSTVKLNFTS